MYIDKLDNIVNKDNHAYHTTFKIIAHILILVKNNGKDSKFKVEDHVRRSKHKTIFEKRYVPNCSEEVFVIKKWTYVISDLNNEEIVGTF